MKYFAFFLVINFQFPLNAETKILDLKGLIQLAKEKNPQIIESRDKIELYEFQTKLLTTSLYPTINWNLNGNYQKDAVYKGSASFNGKPYNQYGSDLKISQTLYAYGSLSAINKADFDKKIQNLNSSIVERDITVNIINSFYKLLLYRELFENLNHSKEIIQKSLSTAEARFKSGRGQLLDVLQVKTQLALIEPKIEDAKNQVEIAANNIAYFTGEKNIQGIKITGELKKLNFDSIIKTINQNEIMRYEYAINELKLNQLDYTKDVTNGANYPTVKFVGDYLFNNYKKAELFSDNSHAYAISLQVNIPLFSGFSSFHEKNILNTTERNLRTEKIDLENSLALNEMVGLKNLKSAETSLVSAEKAASFAHESQLEAAKNYKLATIDFLQFLSVEQSAVDAYSSLLQLKYQSIIAFTNYFVATGIPIYKLTDILN
jgi:outer membrane protein TolC